MATEQHLLSNEEKASILAQLGVTGVSDADLTEKRIFALAKEHNVIKQLTEQKLIQATLEARTPAKPRRRGQAPA